MPEEPVEEPEQPIEPESSVEEPVIQEDSSNTEQTDDNIGIEKTEQQINEKDSVENETNNITSTELLNADNTKPEGNKLPNTATNSFNAMLIGATLFLAGGAAQLVNRRKNHKA